MDVPELHLGTRGSALARAQADRVRAALEAAHPGLRVEMVFIRTSGDAGTQGALGPGGVKGLFVKEIEEALLAGTIDAAVHSMKDLPASLPPGLVVGSVPVRASAHDMLLSDGADALSSLPRGARIGTASVRRRAQLVRQSVYGGGHGDRSPRPAPLLSAGVAGAETQGRIIRRRRGGSWSNHTLGKGPVRDVSRAAAVHRARLERPQGF